MNSKDNLDKLLKLLDTESGKKLLKSTAGRRAMIQTHGFIGFIFIYLRQKISLNLDKMHLEIIDEIENRNGFIGVLGFRGCAKSTILEWYALYSMLERRSKYTVYVGQTDDKSRTAVMNIKNEIETNLFIQQDYQVDVKKNSFGLKEKWAESQITINNNTIIAKSRGSNIRGTKYQDSRISLIICDDLEDTDNTKNMIIRNATRNWFFTELVPALNQGVLGEDSKVIMIGNLVHRDCLLAHLDNKKLDNGEILKILKYPILKENGQSNWKGLYPNMEAIEKQKQVVLLAGAGMGNVIWHREYLLQIISDDEQIIKDTDIHYYEDDWLQRKKLRGGVGIDLAISQKETADYTVMIKGFEVLNDNGENRIIISKNNLRERIDFSTTIAKARLIKVEMPVNTLFYIEKVGYQQSAIETLQKNGVNVKAVSPTTDKRSRLMSVSPYIKSGVVMFPRNGAEDLLNELINFGIESHDDTVDALVYLIDGMLSRPVIAVY